GLVAGWSSAVLVLAGFGPKLRGLGSAPERWPAWALAHPDGALTALATGLAWLLLAWFAVSFLVVVGSAGAGWSHRWCRRAARVLIPRVVRHSLETALGLGIAALTATPALATTTGPTPSIPSLDRAPATVVRLAPVPAVPAPVLAPPANPDPTAAAPQPTPPRPATTTTHAPLPDLDRAVPPKVDDPTLTGTLPPTDEIVVRRGDCLWNVVKRFLGPTARDADIARIWPQWYAHNRSAVGADPDLLLPGTVLTPPPSPAAVP
ncbi:MAG: hypothetical protein QOG60_2238, partial [Frankiaceae bacterium]|nr:hypothetical protein [Frankiaceae bacterium]